MNTFIKNKWCRGALNALCLGACLALNLTGGIGLASGDEVGITPNITETCKSKQALASHTEDLRRLMMTLYEMYPQALKKSTQVSAREMTEWVFDGKAGWKFDAIRHQQGIAALQLVFDSGYQGDRVLALIVGLETMLFQAYNAKNEFEASTPADIKKLNIAQYNIQLLIHQLNQSCTQANAIGLCVNPSEHSKTGNTSPLEHIRSRLNACIGHHRIADDSWSADVIQQGGFVPLQAHENR